MNINLQNCNLEDGFWCVKHPFIAYRYLVKTKTFLNIEEYAVEGRKRAIQRHLYNVYRLILEQVECTDDYKYAYPEKECIYIPEEVLEKGIGKSTFTHHYPLSRIIKHANGEEEVVEGEEITLEVEVKLKETVNDTGIVCISLSTLFYIRRCAFTVEDTDKGFIVTAESFGLPTYCVHPWDELSLTPEQEIDKIAREFANAHCYINIKTSLVKNKEVTPLIDFIINSIKSPMEVLVCTPYTPEYLIEKGYIVGNESATNIEAINNRYLKKLQNKSRKLKKKKKGEIWDKQIVEGLHLPIMGRIKIDVDKITALLSDKIHPVPKNISPGSYDYYLFKARFQYDTPASMKVRNMLLMNEVTPKEQALANQLLDMYKAGYKAGQRLMKDSE